MLRRTFSLAICSLSALTVAPSIAHSSDSPSRGPLFWLAKRNGARVFILGVGAAKDRAWFTPSIQHALQMSAELWLETAPPEIMAKDAELMQRLGQDSNRTLFDALDPSVRRRTLAYVAELGIDRASIQAQRPWLAYFTINSAFWSKNSLPYKEVNVEEVLRNIAISDGKRVQYEMPSGEALARFMAAMPEKAQSQFLSSLLDTLDDHRQGRDSDSFRLSFGWLTGKPKPDNMSKQFPDLYSFMQVKRNEWWVRKIDHLLACQNTYFVATGYSHVLGPDGIPAQLQRRGVVAPSDLRENPEIVA